MKVRLDPAQVLLEFHTFSRVSPGSPCLMVSQSTYDIVLVLQQLGEWKGWSPKAPKREALPARRTMRSQKVGGFEGGRLAEILHLSGTLGVLVVTPQVCLQCFIGQKKRGCGLSQGVVAPSLTQITPSAAEPPSPQMHPPTSRFCFDLPLVEFLRFLSRPPLMTGCSQS